MVGRVNHHQEMFTEAKKNRAVCLISSMHSTIETNEEKNKLEMICF